MPTAASPDWTRARRYHGTMADGTLDSTVSLSDWVMRSVRFDWVVLEINNFGSSRARAISHPPF